MANAAQKQAGLSESIIAAAAQIREELDARAVFIHADAMKDLDVLSGFPPEVAHFATTCSPAPGVADSVPAPGRSACNPRCGGVS